MNVATVPGRPEPRDFDELFRRHYTGVVSLGFVLCGSLEAAEDLAQEAFEAAYRGWERISQYDDPPAWIRRVVANKAVSLPRRRAAELRALLRSRGSADEPRSSEALEVDVALWEAVRRLPRRQAQTVALVYIEDCTLAEVALTIGCNRETARTHLRRGRATLARRLGLALGEVDDDGRP